MKTKHSVFLSAHGLYVILWAILFFGLSPKAKAVVPVQFSPAINSPAGSHPALLASADFNNDGNLDLVVITGSQAVSILLGHGDGTFAFHTNYTVTSFAASLAVGDLNKDGNPDIVVGGSYGGSTLLGDGMGCFTKTNFTWSSAGYSSAIAVGDLNNDSKLDLANAASGLGDNVAVGLGNGDGTWGNPTISYLGKSPVDIAIGDVNSDGKPDLAAPVSSYVDCFCILTNRGNGGFGISAYYAGTNTSDYHYALDLKDYNDDGKLDIAVTHFYSRLVTIWMNQGNGTFVQTGSYKITLSPKGIDAADFNSDGKTDLIAYDAYSAVLLLGNGDGSFAPSKPMDITIGGGSARKALLAGDFNNDGLPDFALCDYYNNSVVVRLNTTPPVLELMPMAGYCQLNWLKGLGVGYFLEYTTNLSSPASWQRFPYPPVLIGNQKAVTDWTDDGQKFYRLKKP